MSNENSTESVKETNEVDGSEEDKWEDYKPYRKLAQKLKKHGMKLSHDHDKEKDKDRFYIHCTKTKRRMHKEPYWLEILRKGEEEIHVRQMEKMNRKAFRFNRESLTKYGLEVSVIHDRFHNKKPTYGVVHCGNELSFRMHASSGSFKDIKKWYFEYIDLLMHLRDNGMTQGIKHEKYMRKLRKLSKEVDNG